MMNRTCSLIMKRRNAAKLVILVAVGIIITGGGVLMIVTLQSSQGPVVFLGVVDSGSMFPSLNVGDIVFVANVTPSTVNIGDVIVYQNGSSTLEIDALIIHRVIDKYQGENETWFFITQGDNSSHQDPDPIPEYNVLGVAVGRIQYLGYLVLWLRGQYLLYAGGVFTILAVLVGVYIYVRKRRRKRMPSNSRSVESTRDVLGLNLAYSLLSNENEESDAQIRKKIRLIDETCGYLEKAASTCSLQIKFLKKKAEDLRRRLKLPH